jgi:hypothetical protein
MYTATDAIGVKKGVNQKWQTIDLDAITVSSMFDQYRKVYLTLQTGQPLITVYLDMDTVRDQYSTYAYTVHQLLVDILNESLPTIDNLPVINTRRARYMDAFRAGYNAQPFDRLYGENTPVLNRPDAIIRRQDPVVNYELFYKTTLVSVNGFYHRTDIHSSNGILIYDAGLCLRKSNQNQLGLLTFHGMCEIQSHSITSEMIRPAIEGASLSNATYIHTNLDLTNKSILFVIGGYMHTLSNIVSRVGDNVFKIDFSNYPLFDRFYEMYHHLDTSNFNLSTSSVNPYQVSTEELQSNENIIALLTMSQSFMVVLDCPEIYTEVNYVRKTGYPGCYISYTDPAYPLVTGLGRHNEYWYREEDGQYALTVYDNAVANRIYNTVNPYLENSISDSRQPTDPVYLSGAYLLMIARDI